MLLMLISYTAYIWTICSFKSYFKICTYLISLIWFKILFYKYFSLQNYMKLYYNNQHSLLVCLKTIKIKINTITFETQKYYKHGMSNLYIYSNLKIFKSDLNSYNILSLCPSTELNKLYSCISINYNVVEKFIYFSNSTQIVKLVY